MTFTSAISDSYNTFMGGYANGTKAAFQALSKTKIPVLSHISGFLHNKVSGKPREDMENQAQKSNQIATNVLENVPAPDSGGATGCCLGAAGGFTGGLVAGALAGGLVFVEIWGPGTGLWVEGEKNDNDGMVTAGRIMILYVTIPLLGLTTLGGGIAGAIAGGFAGAD